MGHQRSIKEGVTSKSREGSLAFLMKKEKWKVSSKNGGILLVKVKKDLKERFQNMCSARHKSMEQTICRLLRQLLNDEIVGKSLFKEKKNGENKENKG